MQLAPRNKKGGAVTGVVLGVGGLLLGVIVILVITSTMIDSDLLGTQTVSTITVANETDASANTTGYSLSVINASTGSYTITAVLNGTTAGEGYYNLTVPLANVSVSSAGVVTNGTVIEYENVSLSYTYVYSTVETTEAYAVENLSANFISGIDQVSMKIPTILTIIAVVLLFSLLIILVAFWKKLMGGDSGSL
jgi:hypothetical protein